MYKVAIVGDRDSIYGFAATGMEVFPVLDQKAALKQISMLSKENYGVIFLTEALYSEMKPYLENFDELAIPAIIPVPGVVGNTGIGKKQVKRSVERAVGSDILFGDR